MDPADFRAVFDQIPVALWNTGTIENHLAGGYFDGSFRKFEEGFSRGNVEKLIVFAALCANCVHDGLADEAVDAAACDDEGMRIVFQLHVTVIQISRINIHKNCSF